MPSWRRMVRSSGAQTGHVSELVDPIGDPQPEGLFLFLLLPLPLITPRISPEPHQMAGGCGGRRGLHQGLLGLAEPGLHL